MNYLCICIGGRVRSVALAKAIEHAGHNAEFIGCVQPEEKIREACNRADYILMVEPRYSAAIPAEYQSRWIGCPAWSMEYFAKRKVVNLGLDLWGDPQHAQLVELCREKVQHLMGNLSVYESHNITYASDYKR